MKVDFKRRKSDLNGNTNYSILLNTGFFDNRVIIGSVNYNEEWYFNADIYSSGSWQQDILEKFDVCLREVSFNSNTGAYELGPIWATPQTKLINNKVECVLKFRGAPVDDNDLDIQISPENFKHKEIKLVLFWVVL